MTGSRKKTTPRGHRAGPADARLDEMIEEAIVDVHGESEQTVGFYTLLEVNRATPFKTEMLGVEVTVERIDMTDDEQIVAVCSRGKSRQRVPILDLALPSPPPDGAEWIMAFRRWAGGGRYAFHAGPSRSAGDNLSAGVRKLGHEHVFYMLNDAIDLLPPAKLHRIAAPACSSSTT